MMQSLRGWFDDYGLLVVLGAIVLSVVLGAVLLGLWLDHEKCDTYQELTGRQVEWRIVGGCFAQDDNGVWWHRDQLWSEGADRR